MSFLQTFFRAFFGLAFLSAVVLLGAREGVLFFATQQVAQQAQRITQLNRWQDFINQCASAELASEGPAFTAIQLRFIDSRQYVTEVVCVNRPPVEILRSTLPFMVRKTTGSAGFSYAYPQRALGGEITLELFGQKRTIFSVQESTESFVERKWSVASDLQSGVVASSCEAHGLKCCNATEEVGEGKSWSDGVLDCPQQCFSQCLRRPILLSFQSDPLVDHETRVVSVPGTSTLVLFAFSFDDAESAISRVVLDFGDGEKQEFATAQQKEVTKEYSCPSGTCQFTATVEAFDARGISSLKNRLSTITIQFGRNPALPQ